MQFHTQAATPEQKSFVLADICGIFPPLPLGEEHPFLSAYNRSLLPRISFCVTHDSTASPTRDSLGGCTESTGITHTRRFWGTACVNTHKQQSTGITHSWRSAAPARGGIGVLGVWEMFTPHKQMEWGELTLLLLDTSWGTINSSLVWINAQHMSGNRDLELSLDDVVGSVFFSQNSNFLKKDSPPSTSSSH